MWPTYSDLVVNAYGCTSTFARVTLFMNDDLPTFGYPATITVRVVGSIDGRRIRCWRTCSRYSRAPFWRLSTVHMRPSAARLSALQR